MRDHIRFATINDLAALQSILENTPSDWSLKILKDCFNPSYFQWIIEVDQTIIGFVVVKNNGDAWELMQIVVDKQYQQQGYAKKLLNHVISMAKQNQVQTLQLEVRSKNSAAIGLYKTLGFIQVGVRKKYYSDGDDAVLMDLRF